MGIWDEPEPLPNKQESVTFSDWLTVQANDRVQEEYAARAKRVKMLWDAATEISAADALELGYATPYPGAWMTVRHNGRLLRIRPDQEVERPPEAIRKSISSQRGEAQIADEWFLYDCWERTRSEHIGGETYAGWLWRRSEPHPERSPAARKKAGEQAAQSQAFIQEMNDRYGSGPGEGNYSYGSHKE